MGEDGGSGVQKTLCFERLFDVPKILPFVIYKGDFSWYGRTFPFSMRRSVEKERRNMKNKNATKMVTVAMLSSISYLLIMLDFPFPGLPAFLKIDFSEVPALIAAIIFGPGGGIIVEAIKNVLHYGIQGSLTGVPVGEIANFIAGCIFILPVSYFFRKYRTVKGLTVGLVAGTTAMTLIMSILNYFVILPAYTWFLNAPAMSNEATRQLIVTGILPFNVIKGILIAVVFVLLFSRLKVWMNTKINNA
jgi:riboflavin transporter FmnP